MINKIRILMKMMKIQVTRTQKFNRIIKKKKLYKMDGLLNIMTMMKMMIYKIIIVMIILQKQKNLLKVLFKAKIKMNIIHLKTVFENIKYKNKKIV